MSRSITAVANSNRSLASRAVHIVIEPQPHCIHERRQILRVLKDFGEIVMFKSLRYENPNPAPNSALAIYHTPEAASRLLAASPLRFYAEPVDGQPLVTSAASFGIARVFEDDSDVPLQISQSDTENQIIPINPTPCASTNQREIHLSIDKSFADHQSHISRQEYYWGHVPNTKSFAYGNLRRTVPSEGLATISTKTASLPNRVVLKNISAVADRKTLRQIWDDGCQTSRP